MLDAKIRPMIDPTLNRAGKTISRLGIHANWITIFGFGVGIGAIFLIANRQYLAGLTLILINRLCDGLDGSVARTQGGSDFGDVLDTVCDFLIYSGVIFSFALAQPHNAVWASFLLMSYMGAGSSFLAYAVMAEKYGLDAARRSEKALYYFAGVSEGTETILVMTLLCVLPTLMPFTCVVYGIMCLMTCFGRLMKAKRDFL